ncbi:MAG: glycosyltransferase family 9 protein, partial [Bdellovibrionota bacterium]
WGDLYVSLAALAEVCELHSEVVLIGSEKWKDLIDPRTWPKVNEIWVSEDGWTCERFAWHNDEWVSAGPSALRAQLRRVHTSYNLRTESLRYGWAPALARVPARHGSAPFPWDHLLYTHRAPWLGKDPRIHERDRLLQVVEAPDRIGELVKVWKLKSGLPILRKVDRSNGERVANAKAGTYFLVNPTSSRREKAWPSAQFQRLVETLLPLLEQRQLTLRVIGAPTESVWLRETLPEGLSEREFLVQPAKNSDLCDVLSGAVGLLTNASSMQFLAASYDITTVTLTGRGDRVIWGPLGSRDVIVQGTVDRALDAKIFEQERAAYESLPFDRVLEACLRIIG